MLAFLSTQTHRKDQVVARTCICLFALLFFICAALSAFPSLASVNDYFTQNGLAGYTENEDKSTDRYDGALKQFTDRPNSRETGSVGQDADGETPSALAPTGRTEHAAV